ncbi:virulence factor SrfB, partial [Pantoea vagans]|uniref:virulence factor SrfB n=1 Tax=Pantoea vagans TaxID=470934 RepID=UPI00289F1705
MLAPLIDDKQKISLIENSGVQFLDFGLQLSATQARRQFVRQTANGPLLRLNVDGNSGKFMLYPEDGGAAEVVRPESDIALADSLTLLAACWLPLPMLRCASGRRFIGGPENWARMRLVALPAPDAAGNTHRVTLAFDTRCVAEQDGGEPLGLSAADAQNGVPFALAWPNHELGAFLHLT